MCQGLMESANPVVLTAETFARFASIFNNEINRFFHLNKSDSFSAQS